MGLTVKRQANLERMMDQFTTKKSKIESDTEKEKRDKFLKKSDKNKK